MSVSKARATPLMLAAAQGHVQTCITLVEVSLYLSSAIFVFFILVIFQHGASIEIRDKLQRTALIHAAMNGHYPVITLFLNKGSRWL